MTITLARSSLARLVIRSNTSSPRRSVHQARETNAIMMPAMSPLMTEGTIKRWRKKEGDSFVAGDILLQVESDIATIDVEAENAGIITKILIPEGSTNIPVEQAIALVVAADPPRARSSGPLTSPTSRPRSASPRTLDRAARPRTTFRFETHITTSPSSGFNAHVSSPTSTGHSPGAVRGIGTTHARNATIHGIPSPTCSTPSRAESEVDTPSSPSMDYASPSSVNVKGLDNQRSTELDGDSIRRLIQSNLSRNPSKQRSTAEYFDGLL